MLMFRDQRLSELTDAWPAPDRERAALVLSTVAAVLVLDFANQRGAAVCRFARQVHRPRAVFRRELPRDIERRRFTRNRPRAGALRVLLRDERDRSGRAGDAQIDRRRRSRPVEDHHSHVVPRHDRRCGRARRAFCRQREGEHVVAQRSAEILVPARRDDKILASCVRHVRHRRRVHAGGQLERPELGAGVRVERVQPPIECAAGEYDAARRRERAAKVRRSPSLASGHRAELLDAAERHFPLHVARLEVHRGQRAERRRRAGHAIGSRRAASAGAWRRPCPTAAPLRTHDPIAAARRDTRRAGSAR